MSGFTKKGIGKLLHEKKKKKVKNKNNYYKNNFKKIAQHLI